jgi:hypothetical protein
MVVMNSSILGGLAMGACHAFQLRRWILMAIELRICVILLLGALAVVASPTAFKDVRTDFGLLPFHLSGLMQLMCDEL